MTLHVPKELYGRLYHDMLRIRLVEQALESEYHLDEMKTPIHLCIGQEGVAVGVCAALKKDDFLQSNHRGHGHYLAKGGDLKALIAELFCRETGCSRGRGGSMHLVDVSVGNFGSSSIVGGGIPISVGQAFAARMRGQNRVSAVFFGDGAANQGVLYESINFALLKSLPVLFILENNEYSVCSHISTRQKGPCLFHFLPPDMLPSICVDGNDVLAVYEAAEEAVRWARAGKGPSFLECRTYRLRGHAGSYSDANLGYRSAEEIACHEAECPLFRLRNKLLAENLFTEDELNALRQPIQVEIAAAFEFARQSPLPLKEDVSRYVFMEQQG